MNEENTPHIPNLDGEEMKLPENIDVQQVTQEQSSVINGSLLLLLTLLLLAILGGMYYWFGTMTTSNTQNAPVAERPTAEQNQEPESTTARAQADSLLTTSPSDELGAIEADIEATDLDSLDLELQAIEAEFEAARQ